MPDRWLEAARQGEVQRAIVESVPLPTILHNEEQVLYANPAALRLYGARDLSEMVGKNIFELAHPDSESAARERVALIYTRGLDGQRLATKIVTLDGRALNCVVTAYPLHLLGRDLIITVVMSTER
ncbi:MAG: hypothetical protein CVT59_10730 [Actinobacteria bacterium HGW-Actinobacteria-1]|jgi:PAS domain S-box-containing protein|nr:MAG: hypothetical protein CVT59_10730 [Actinobacteria bacterium HGW-Actinobacteria-1]